MQVNPGKAVSNPGNIYFQNEGYCSLGDETPKSYGAPGPNSKPALARSQTGLAAGGTLVANSVSKADAPQGAQARGQEEGGKAMLLNGKMLEKTSLEDEALSKGFSPEQGARGALVEAEVAEQPKGALTPNTQAGTEEKQPKKPQMDPEKPPAESSSQQEEKSLLEVLAEGSGSPGKTEPAPKSPPASSNCADGDGCGEHADPSRATTVTSGTLSALKREPSTPLPTLQEESKESSSEEEDEGEETPKAGSPTRAGPPACLTVSNVRMPASLLQLLEDSIEC